MIKMITLKETGKKATRVGMVNLVERIRAARLSYDPEADEVVILELDGDRKVVLKAAKVSGADLMDELCEIKALRRG